MEAAGSTESSILEAKAVFNSSRDLEGDAVGRKERRVKRGTFKR